MLGCEQWLESILLLFQNTIKFPKSFCGWLILLTGKLFPWSPHPYPNNPPLLQAWRLASAPQGRVGGGPRGGGQQHTLQGPASGDRLPAALWLLTVTSRQQPKDLRNSGRKQGLLPGLPWKEGWPLACWLNTICTLAIPSHTPRSTLWEHLYYDHHA